MTDTLRHAAQVQRYIEAYAGPDLHLDLAERLKSARTISGRIGGDPLDQLWRDAAKDAHHAFRRRANKSNNGGSDGQD